MAGFWLLGDTAQAQGGGWERERVAIFYADSRQASCASPQDMVYLTQLLEEQFLRLLPKNRYVLIQGADLITLMQSFSQKAGDQTSCNDQSCAQIARKAQAKIFLEQRFDCARRQVSLTLKRLNQGAVELVERRPPVRTARRFCRPPRAGLRQGRIDPGGGARRARPG